MRLEKTNKGFAYRIYRHFTQQWSIYRNVSFFLVYIITKSLVPLQCALVFKRNNTAFKKAKHKIKLFSQQTCKKPALFSASMFLKLIFCTTIK